MLKVLRKIAGIVLLLVSIFGAPSQLYSDYSELVGFLNFERVRLLLALTAVMILLIDPILSHVPKIRKKYHTVEIKMLGLRSISDIVNERFSATDETRRGSESMRSSLSKAYSQIEITTLIRGGYIEAWLNDSENGYLYPVTLAKIQVIPELLTDLCPTNVLVKGRKIDFALNQWNREKQLRNVKG